MLRICLQLILLMVTAIGYAKTADADNHTSKHNNTALIIDDIICHGNDTTECSFIRKKYYQNMGDILDPDEIVDAKLRLGTLIQFQHIDVYLKKGRKRGHVVVVFDIKEASNLQYELSYDVKRTESKEDFYACFGDVVPENKKEIINLCDRDKYRISETEQYVSAKTTNFNFLGTGKELSLILSGYEYDKTADHFKQSLIDPSDTDNWSTRHISSLQRISLDYYDPHLFDSPYYYVNAHTQLTKTRTRYTQADNVSTETSHEEFTPNNKTWLTIGRRFARYSYVSLSIAGDLDRKINQNYYINYGFNSENDTLFPVHGEKFSSRFITLSHGHRQEFSYLSHFNLDDFSAVSFGLSTDYYKESNLHFYSKTKEIALSAQYMSYKVIDAKAGKYAGWSLGTTIRKKQDWYDHNPQEDFRIIELDAEYTYQTQSMVYRFSLKAGLNERH